jgi:hypothetical protein
MRPRRLVRRALAYLKDADAQACVGDATREACEFVDDFRGKFVTAGRYGRIGYSLAGWWQWARWAVNRFSAEFLAVGLDWINDE